MSLRNVKREKMQFIVDNVMFDIFINFKNKKTQQHIVYT